MSDRSSTKPTLRASSPSRSDSPTVQIAIRKGDVRRAIHAANAVYELARETSKSDVEDGMVLMTAVLLVERLAAASNCEPISVLNKMADCFEFKKLYAKSLKHGWQA